MSSVEQLPVSIADLTTGGIRKYRVKLHDYFGNLEMYIKGMCESSRIAYGYVESKELCKDPMNQLVEKYDLSNKDVFSLAPNFGHEEYWFYKNGCTLTFLDIDEGKIIENYLETLRPSSHENSLTYFIGNANQFSKEYTSPGKYEVFYVSGFTLDELRRGEIQTRNSGCCKKALNSFAYRILKKRLLATWPMNEKPYMDLVMNLVSNSLKEGGLFISQSYGFGVDVKSNRHFVNLVKTQLSSIGVTLLKLYCLKSIPSVTLTIGLRGDDNDARDYLEKTSNSKDITSFHGRSLCSGRGSEVVYEYSALG